MAWKTGTCGAHSASGKKPALDLWTEHLPPHIEDAIHQILTSMSFSNNNNNRNSIISRSLLMPPPNLCNFWRLYIKIQALRNSRSADLNTTGVFKKKRKKNYYDLVNAIRIHFVSWSQSKEILLRRIRASLFKHNLLNGN